MKWKTTGFLTRHPLHFFHSKRWWCSKTITTAAAQHFCSDNRNKKTGLDRRGGKGLARLSAYRFHCERVKGSTERRDDSHSRTQPRVNASQNEVNLIFSHQKWFIFVSLICWSEFWRIHGFHNTSNRATFTHLRRRCCCCRGNAF